MKKIGSNKGQTGVVTSSIPLPGKPVVIAIDAEGNWATFSCFIPPARFNAELEAK
jgi:hypothetical protein